MKTKLFFCCDSPSKLAVSLSWSEGLALELRVEDLRPGVEIGRSHLVRAAADIEHAAQVRIFSSGRRSISSST